MADYETLAVYAEKVEDYVKIGLSETQVTAINAMMARLSPGARLLDIGCGPGIHAALFQEGGLKVTALDASPEFVAAAQTRGVDATRATFDDLKAMTARYDAVWASFSLLHTKRADFPGYLADAIGLLRPGGWFFLGMKLGTGEKRDALGRFYSFYSVDELTQHLTDNCLRVDAVTQGAETGLAGNVDPFALIYAEKTDG